jgi:hypothetical protein
MNQPEPQSLSFPTLMGDIEKGLIKIPQFQRDFVWTKEKSALLLDSMLKGFPVGTFIFWKTKETLRTVRNLGDAILPDTPEGDFTQHVLDGQQRLTSLYASAKGLKIKREERTDDFSELFIDLNAKDEDQIVTVEDSGVSKKSAVAVVDLLDADIEFLASYPKKMYGKLSEYQRRLQTYSFSIILVKEAPLDVATEIFTRINVTGRPLSVFEIMVAKTFDSKRNFDLSDEYDSLVERLSDVYFDTIPTATVLQTISSILVKECSKKHILKLKKDKFIEVWPSAIEAIYAAVDYFRNYFRIPVSRLLPYGALLVPFAYFFYKRPNKPTGNRQKYLEDFFWRTSLAGRYSHSLESRLAQDIKRIEDIISGKKPSYDYPVDVSAEFIEENGWFGTGRSYIKAILCLFAYRQPKSFVDNSIVRISNDWLKQANSKNYHHFFPKAFLKKKGYDNWEINHIANITIVDDYLVRQAKLGASCRVQVPVGRGIRKISRKG